MNTINTHFSNAGLFNNIVLVSPSTRAFSLVNVSGKNGNKWLQLASTLSPAHF